MAVFLFPFSAQRAAVLSGAWCISFRSAFFSAEVAAPKSVSWRLLLPSARVQREHPLQNRLLLFTQHKCENQSKERELLSSIPSLTGMRHPVGRCRGGISPWTSEDGRLLLDSSVFCVVGWEVLCSWVLLCTVILQRLQKYCVTVTVLRMWKERSRVYLMGRMWPDGVQAGMIPPPEHQWVTAAFVRGKQPQTSIECEVEILVAFDLFSSSRWEIFVIIAPEVQELRQCFITWYCQLAVQHLHPFLPTDEGGNYWTRPVGLHCVFNKRGEQHWPPCCFIQWSRYKGWILSLVHCVSVCLALELIAVNWMITWCFGPALMEPWQRHSFVTVKKQLQDCRR